MYVVHYIHFRKQLEERDSLSKYISMEGIEKVLQELFLSTRLRCFYGYILFQIFKKQLLS